jgi:hypothetical protein
MISLDDAGAGLRPAELRICEGYLARPAISSLRPHPENGAFFVHI